MIFYRTERTFTGRANVLPGWFGRMHIEVEVLVQTVVPQLPPMPGMNAEQRAAWRARPPEVISEYTEWRRATWEDLRDAGELVLAVRGHIPPRSMPSVPKPGPWPGPPPERNVTYAPPPKEL